MRRIERTLKHNIIWIEYQFKILSFLFFYCIFILTNHGQRHIFVWSRNTAVGFHFLPKHDIRIIWRFVYPKDYEFMTAANVNILFGSSWVVCSSWNDITSLHIQFARSKKPCMFRKLKTKNICNLYYRKSPTQHLMLYVLFTNKHQSILWENIHRENEMKRIYCW